MTLYYIVFSAIFIAFLIFVVLGIRVIIRKFSELSSQNRLLKALRSLDELALSDTKNEPLFKGIVDVIHKELGFTFAVLALLDKKANLIRRVAISLDPQTTEALHEMLPIKFNDQTVSLSNTKNLFTTVILEKKAVDTKNLFDIQVGILPEEVSNKIQKKWNLKSIFLYPVLIRGEIIGILEYSSTKEKEKHSNLETMIMEAFTNEVSRVLDNAFLYQNLRNTTVQLTVANQKLQDLDKLKDDFVSVASHELRTPMTAIRSYVWMALNRPDITLSEKMKKYLSRSLISTERLINLVNDMLNLSRIEAGKIEIRPQVFEICTLVEEVLDEVRAKANEKMIHLLANKGQLPKLFADPDKVHQVLLNLIGNSLKFTPTDGTISLSFFTDGKFVDVSVKDSGVGISQEDLGRLFKKFGRLDNSYVAAATVGGTGLGLFISKSLVELMGGKIWASSEGLRKGTTFTFSLPIATPEILAQAEKFTKKVASSEMKTLEPVAI